MTAKRNRQIEKKPKDDLVNQTSFVGVNGP